MNKTIDRQQLAFHVKWRKDPKSYVKPTHDPLAPRQAHLLHAPNENTSLGYILIENGKIISTMQAPACEFRFDDPEPSRSFVLTRREIKGFLVYYKHNEFWYSCQQVFPTLSDTIPYLQSGIRVLVEYK